MYIYERKHTLQQYYSQILFGMYSIPCIALFYVSHMIRNTQSVSDEYGAKLRTQTRLLYSNMQKSFMEIHKKHIPAGYALAFMHLSFKYCRCFLTAEPTDII